MAKWRDGWEEKLQEALRAVKILDKASYVEVKIRYDGQIEVLAYPDQNDDEKRQLVNGLTHLVGRLDKNISGSEISLQGSKEGISVTIPAYAKCEIVGFVEREIPETVTTGKMVKQRIPVSDCEIKQGKYKGESVILKSGDLEALV